MALARRDPFRALDRWFHGPRWLEEPSFKSIDRDFFRGFLGKEDGRFDLDVYTTENEAVVKAGLAGIKPEDVKITITGNHLVIEGETKEEEERTERNYLVRERRHGSYRRMVTLPKDVDTDKAEAKFEDGILTLTLPKVEGAKPKTLKVQVAWETK